MTFFGLPNFLITIINSLVESILMNIVELSEDGIIYLMFFQGCQLEPQCFSFQMGAEQ